MNAEYLVVIERTDRNWSAHIPDLPGCVATGKTREKALDRLREAVRIHLEGMKDDALPVPPPSSQPAWLHVAA